MRSEKHSDFVIGGYQIECTLSMNHLILLIAWIPGVCNIMPGKGMRK